MRWGREGDDAGFSREVHTSATVRHPFGGRRAARAVSAVDLHALAVSAPGERHVGVAGLALSVSSAAAEVTLSTVAAALAGALHSTARRPCTPYT